MRSRKLHAVGAVRRKHEVRGSFAALQFWSSLAVTYATYRHWNSVFHLGFGDRHVVVILLHGCKPYKVEETVTYQDVNVSGQPLQQYTLATQSTPLGSAVYEVEDACDK